MKNVINNILAMIYNFLNLVLCSIRSERSTYRGRWWVPLKPKNLASLFRLALPNAWELEVWAKHHYDVEWWGENNFDGGDWEWCRVMYTDPCTDEKIPLTVFGATCLPVMGMRWVFVGSNPIKYRWIRFHFEESRWVVCQDDRWFGR